MDKEYWLKTWALKDIQFHSDQVDSHLIEYIEKLKLQPGDLILVPLCGKTRDLMWLAKAGFRVIGVEISPIACEEFFSDFGITPNIIKTSSFTKYQYENITLFCGDIFNLNPNDLPNIRAIFDHRALIALPAPLRTKYVNHLLHCASDNHIKILLIVLHSSNEVKGPPFPISDQEIKILYGKDFEITKLSSENILLKEHLVRKGYDDLAQSVYLISSHQYVLP